MKKSIIILFLSLLFTSAYAQEKSTDTFKNTEQNKVEVSELNYVKVSDVTEKSVLILTEITEIREYLQESDKVKDMQAALQPYCISIDALLENKNYKHIQNQNVRELQKMGSELSIHLKQLSEWEVLVKESINKYATNKEKLENELEVWKETYSNALEENAPQSLLDHILVVTKDISDLGDTLKSKYDNALINSQRITSKTVDLKDIQKKLKETEIAVSNRVFQQNQEPFFAMDVGNDVSTLLYVKSVFISIKGKYRESVEYLLTNSDLWVKFSMVSFLSLLFIIYYNYLYRKRKLFTSRAALDKKIFFFIGKPFATYAILFTLGMVFVFSNRPHSMSELVLILLFFPVVRIIQTVLEKKYYRYVYTIFGIYVLFWLGKNSLEYELESRVLMMLVNIALFVYVTALVYKKILLNVMQNRLTKLANYLLITFVFLLVIAFGSNLYGSVLLSSRIIDGILSIFYTAMIFYTLYIILTGYIVVMLRRRIASASNMLDKYSKNIEKTTRLLIKVWMLLWWLLIVVKTVSLYPLLVVLKDDVLAFSFSISHTVVSVQGIFDFIFIVVGTWLLARFVKTVLEVEVFARFNLPRGVPTAILTTLNYIIIITGTIIAFSSLGVSPQQFALIFGALGVGIGFGLRNIIANFVSGIIMVFERPVQIGDVIEVDKTMGSVQSIGARSSTVKTFDGSEVIIPNADFIAKEIINWTLSDERRRKVVEFKVDLDNDIDEILSIMKDVATSHPDVLSDPEPLATLKSFGEYYLEFKLYFWLSDNLITAQSDVNIKIYRTLREAGIKMPIPKTNLEGLKK